MSGARMPSEAERREFVAKLAQFRARLGARQQQMLDELVAAGRQAHEQGDVEVYWLCGPFAAPSDVWAAYTDIVADPDTAERR